MKNTIWTIGVFFTLCFINSQQVLAQSPQVKLFGKVMDAETGDPLIGANVMVSGTKTGTITDLDGEYSLLWHQDKEVVLECAYTGFTNQKITVETLYKRVVEVNFEMESGVELEEVVVVGYSVPLVESDNTTMGSTVTSEDIKHRPKRDVGSLAAKTSGVAVSEKSEDLTIRGSRSDATYYVDGVRVKGKKSKTKKRKKEMAFMDMASPSESFAFEPASIAEATTLKAEAKADISAGTLTAGEIHDFSKWELWQDIATEDLNQWESHWNFHLTDRYTVQILNKKGFPIVGASVFLEKDKKTIWTAKTDNTGKAELWNGVFDKEKQVVKATHIKVEYMGRKHEIEQLIPFNQGINFLKIDENCKENNVLDIAFVVDATGSMGDEIAYLQTELKDVIEKVQAQQEALTINLGSVFYKDETDDYVTQKSDFSSDISAAMKFMQAQKAGGGGDYPEAMDAALDVALNQLKWSDKTVAKLLFLVLDAPPHYTPEILKKLEELTHLAAEKGVRIIPVAGSGIDKSTEYLMRSFALATNGTYVFLTDHSGVGNPHIEPTTDEYEVEKFNDLLIRVIGQFTKVAVCDDSTAITDNATADVDNPTDASKNAIVCYPNPTTGVFKVKLKNAVKELFITDSSGKILLRFDNPKVGETDINLANFPNGVYFVRFLEDEKLQTGRVVLAY